MLAAFALWAEWHCFTDDMPLVGRIATIVLTVVFYEFFRWVRRRSQLGGMYFVSSKWDILRNSPLPIFVIIAGFSALILAMMIVYSVGYQIDSLLF